jgi:dynein heavy chain
LCNSFLGLAQTGAWGCFDDFNRISIEVLSVVAQHILCILSALAERAKSFVFEGEEINLVLSCGILITMDPGRRTCHFLIYEQIGSYSCNKK